MKKIIKFIKDNFEQIRIISLFVLSTIILIILFPQQAKFRYEFQKGKPWMHDEFIAPFDFPIYKTENEVTAERDSILSEFKPYFVRNIKVAEEQFSRFNTVFEEKWTVYKKQILENDRNNRLQLQSGEKKEIYKNIAVDLIEFIYSKGIVENNDVLERIDNPELTIVILEDQFAEERPYSEVFTQKGAYEYVLNHLNSLTDSLPEENAPGFFRDLNINEFLLPNLSYDEETSTRVKNELISELSLTKGMVQSGQRIVSRGEIVTTEKYRILESLRKEYEANLGLSDHFNIISLGKIILIVLSMIVLYLFLHNYRQEILRSFSYNTFILLLVLLTATFSSFMIKYEFLSLYVLPFAIVPIMIRTFFDARLALFIHILTILVIGFWAPNSFEFVFLNIIAGIVALFSLTNVYRRGILFNTSVIIIITYSVLYFSFSVIQEGKLATIDYTYFLWFAGNGLLILTAYPLIFIAEKAFGFLSDATLLELSDANQPLLRELAENAPGTFQHSLQVASLAEDVIYHLGGNPLLIRTGALYHDIGKMANPLFFIENQNSEYNPHDGLEFEKSAEIIINHVNKGVEIARKHNLPEQIINFIKTHHGTTQVQYFYRSFLKSHPGEEADLSMFTYPGPVPFSRESAILMMADSVEASSRSLKVKNEEILTKLVDKIIDDQLNQHQFDNADITFKDISGIKEILRKKLLNIYHVRIKYPL